jgi:hypothetical protein
MPPELNGRDLRLLDHHVNLGKAYSQKLGDFFRAKMRTRRQLRHALKNRPGKTKSKLAEKVYKEELNWML